MSKGPKNKLYFLWVTVVIVCVVITYYYQKSKAAEEYQKILEVAAKNCDSETVKSLVKKSRDASIVSKEALYYAAEKGCLEIVIFLLDEGIDKDTINLALLSATDGGQLEVIKLLLKRGANPHAGDWKGRTAKTIAIRSSYHESNKPYREIIDLLDKAERSYKPEK